MTARNVATSCQDGQYSAYGSNFNVGTTSVWIVITSRLVATPAQARNDAASSQPVPARPRRDRKISAGAAPNRTISTNNIQIPNGCAAKNWPGFAPTLGAVRLSHTSVSRLFRPT